MRPPGVPLQEFHPHPLSPSFSHPAPRHSLNPQPDHFRNSHRQPPGLPEQTAFLYPSGVSFVTNWPPARPAPAPKPRPRTSPSPKLWQAKPNPAAARSQVPASAPARRPPAASPAPSSAPAQRLAPRGSGTAASAGARARGCRRHICYGRLPLGTKKRTWAPAKNGQIVCIPGRFTPSLSLPRRLNVISVQINKVFSESFPSSPPSFFLPVVRLVGS